MKIHTTLGEVREFNKTEEDQIVSLLRDKQISPDDLGVLGWSNQSGLYWANSEFLFESAMIDEDTMNKLSVQHFGILDSKTSHLFLLKIDGNILSVDKNDNSTTITFNDFLSHLKKLLS